MKSLLRTINIATWILIVTGFLSLAQAAGCGYSETFADRFDRIAYNGNDGSLAWFDNWQEINDDNDPKEESVKIKDDQSKYSLRIEIKKNRSIGIRRSADLSPYLNAAYAALSFDYRRSGLRETTDFIAVEVSPDGMNWSELTRISGPGTDAGYQSVSVDLLGHLATRTWIRFISSNIYNEDYKVYIDNVQITVENLNGCPAGQATHYAIAHAGTGVSCQSNRIDIARHTANHRVETNAYSGTIQITTTGGQGNWQLIQGLGVLTDRGNGQASYHFASTDKSMVSLGFTSDRAGTVNFDITDGILGEAATEDPDLILSGISSQQIADDFNTRGYAGNTGGLTWAGTWQELNDDGRPDKGQIRIKNDQNDERIRIRGNKNINRENGFWRAANLTQIAHPTSVTLNLDVRRDKIKRASDFIRIEVSADNGQNWSELGRISGTRKEKTYRQLSYDLTGYISKDFRLRFRTSAGFDKGNKVYIDNVQITFTLPACGNTGADHFVIGHDGMGVYCAAEPVSVLATLANGQPDTSYTGTISLDTGTGTGDWTLAQGQGALLDPTPGDGKANYQFSGTDQGLVRLLLDYRSGPATINIAVADGTILDDNSEGPLLFSPSGLILSAAPLGNPPLLPVNTAFPAHISGSSFPIYVTAFGQLPGNAVCGVIEQYSGQKSIRLWSRYLDPVTGTRQVAIDGTVIATNEGQAQTQGIVFNQGQATINARYADAGLIAIGAKDTSAGNPDLPNGIKGMSSGIVMKPASLTLDTIRRTIDGYPNPGAVNALGPVFDKAGQAFSVRVTARDLNGAVTPNFGQEIVPESVRLNVSLIAPIGGNQPALDAPVGFNGRFVNGMATGTDFSWPEAGIVSLTPAIADGDYLGGGAVTGNSSGPIGRFTPDHFDVTMANNPALRTQCGSFTYTSQPIDYATPPHISITASAKGGQRTQNYQGVWWRLPDITPSFNHNGPLPADTILDTAGLSHTPLSCPACAGTITVPFSGTMRYTTTRPDTNPFIGNLEIGFPVVDSDGVAYAGNPFLTAPIPFDQGGEIRSGRGFAKDTYGTYAQISDYLAIDLSSQYYDDATGGWTNNAADSCSTIGFSRTDSGITTAASPASPVTLVNGIQPVTMTLTADQGTPGGKTVLDLSWPTWLNGTPQASATFGLFRGDDRRIHWSEAH